jgi:hypothetical protein
MNFRPHLDNFIKTIGQGSEIELYNEAGLQHELGFYLKTHLPVGWKIQLERNIVAITKTKKGFCKKEIDIFLTDGNKKTAIELKLPVNKQVPRIMEHTLEDVRFLEQLKAIGFDQCYLLFASHGKSFWKSTRKHKIYEYFNDGIFQTLVKSDVPKFIKGSKTAFKKLNKRLLFSSIIKK